MAFRVKNMWLKDMIIPHLRNLQFYVRELAIFGEFFFHLILFPWIYFPINRYYSYINVWQEALSMIVILMCRYPEGTDLSSCTKKGSITGCKRCMFALLLISFFWWKQLCDWLSRLKCALVSGYPISNGLWKLIIITNIYNNIIIIIYNNNYIPNYYIPFTGKHEPNKLTCSQLCDFIAQLVRALHRHRRGHGFESRWVTWIFQVHETIA